MASSNLGYACIVLSASVWKMMYVLCMACVQITCEVNIVTYRAKEEKGNKKKWETSALHTLESSTFGQGHSIFNRISIKRSLMWNCLWIKLSMKKV